MVIIRSVWKADYDPFGKATITTELITNNLRFPGQYYDAETGLHYNYFRDYDPSIGRYIESDPIGLYGGLNTYGYVGGNPLNRIDPTGEAQAVVAIVIVAGVVYSLWIANDIICKCEKKYPQHRDLESSDYHEFFKCLGILKPFLKLFGIAVEPVTGSANEIGVIIGEHTCESCEH